MLLLLLLLVQLLLLRIHLLSLLLLLPQGQELTFFSRLPAGELMARTSGDSLTLRSMFTSTAYQVRPVYI